MPFKKTLYYELKFTSLNADDFNGQFCGQGKYPLINGVKQYLNNILNASTQPSIKTVSILTTEASTAKSTTVQKTTTKKTTTKKLTTKKTTTKKLTTKKTTTKSTTVRTSSITNLTTKNGDLCFNNDGFYPVLNTGCKEFYRCTHSGTIWQIIERFKCPSGTLFNNKTNNCDWISNVICSEG
ncbi:unnamed protein product [Brachionus calyciflorus]|uniref:Chitin-binding type-2 domain-containing protein n=1 Tax=Brachionus calyciflorus TaxID=104777 RepID=A0A813SU14_9BILA|nr:unnamed protein product [Brachionus calyciflorus]